MDKRKLPKTQEHRDKLRLSQPHRIEPPEKKNLEKLYLIDRKSSRDIALMLKTNQRRVMSWLKLYQIPRRSYKENVPPNRGKELTNDHKTRISKALKGNTNMPTGEEHFNWQGGVTPINAKVRNSLEYKEWRNKVFERDNYTCQNCKIRGGKLEADHIKPFCKYKELRLIINNGRTLCKECHKKIGWQFFKEENPRKRKNA